MWVKNNLMARVLKGWLNLDAWQAHLARLVSRDPWSANPNSIFPRWAAVTPRCEDARAAVSSSIFHPVPSDQSGPSSAAGKVCVWTNQGGLHQSSPKGSNGVTLKPLKATSLKRTFRIWPAGLRGSARCDWRARAEDSLPCRLKSKCTDGLGSGLQQQNFGS